MPYRIEYAPSNRSACKGAIPCKGTKINKGELRLGTLAEIAGNQSFFWRHWGCVTDRVLNNMQDKDGLDTADDLDGFEDLRPEDQERVRRAFEQGHVAPEDIPLSARKSRDQDGGAAEASEEEPAKEKRG
ncbi:zf-PARP-domain-containing protein [Violaceomyces palustris]|uniref:Zf-PARP-domain-containing protein n=1 Tax=Violaceomyces palustris TaxID=1673888 RepID=A0ACD0NV27_9BASI|nr:zf-PARP-domain-containing protein [Violaceomyces palustris]